ncbi:MAG: methyltransferase domain-containing protein [Magnetococcales bacterium]|nr:methyltransferase domain-containing protein [Magnetococcales bacterium]MBF0321596.1 methyltransferase domain-containing protein [Magnetococcales bacterium]
MEPLVGHHPKHLFDPKKAASLLDPQRRMVADPLALVREMGIFPGMRVVDLGCGAGFFTQALLEATGATGRVAAVELQEPIFAMLQERLGKHPRLDLLLTNLLDTGLDSGGWDAVFSAFTLHEVPVGAALMEIRRIVRPGGLLAILDWGHAQACPERETGQKAGPPEAERLLPEVLRRQLAEAGWQETAFGERLGGCHYWINAR